MRRGPGYHLPFFFPIYSIFQKKMRFLPSETPCIRHWFIRTYRRRFVISRLYHQIHCSVYSLRYQTTSRLNIETCGKGVYIFCIREYRDKEIIHQKNNEQSSQQDISAPQPSSHIIIVKLYEQDLKREVDIASNGNRTPCTISHTCIYIPCKAFFELSS